MATVLSELARQFIDATWGERQPHVEDLGLVRAAIEEGGLPVTEPVLDFHGTFAGYMTDVWGERGPLGIIHTEVVATASWFEPMKVGCYIGMNGKANAPLLACADIHISWEMMIGLDGTFYCNGPEASSYFFWVEQGAFIWDYHRRHRIAPLLLDAEPDELTAVLLPRLESHRVESLSDEYAQLYAADNWLVSAGQQGARFNIWTVAGARPEVFKGFRTDSEEPTFEELAADLRSDFESRRYQAVCRIRNSADPAVAPLFLIAVHDTHEHTRIIAIQGLGRLRSTDAIPVLGQLIRDEPAEMVVFNAVAALKGIGGVATYPHLIEATRHQVAFIRRDAVIALGEIGDTSAIPALEARFADEDRPKMYTGIRPSLEDKSVAAYARDAVKKIRKRTK